MSAFLLDTNLISELVRAKPEHRVTSWLESIDENRLYLSVLTLGEIRKEISVLPESKRRAQLESWLDLDLEARFSGRILVVDEAIAKLWGTLAGRAQKRGAPLAVIDGLLAATAIQHNLKLVTRNVDDFVDSGVATFNPWKEQV